MSADAVLDALGLGSRTHRIAARLGWTTAKSRRALGKLEREGRVERHARYTAANDIYWMPSTKWRQRLQPDPFGCPYTGTPKPCPLCDCARRDSDGSPQGGNAEGGAVHDSADPKGIAR